MITRKRGKAGKSCHPSPNVADNHLETVPTCCSPCLPCYTVPDIHIRFPSNLVTISGTLLGLASAANRPVYYGINGAEGVIYTDSNGFFTLSAPVGSNVVILPGAVPGYTVSPEIDVLPSVRHNMANRNFVYKAMVNGITLSRATSVIPAYGAAPNTWPLHGSLPPDLYMVDRVLITLPPSPPVVVKWAYGVQDAAYFATDGFDITATYQQGLPTTLNTAYTVYAQLADGFTGVASIIIDHLRDGSVAMPYLLIDFSTATGLEPAIPGIGQFTLDFMQGGGDKLTYHYELYQDIDMAGHPWVPVGTYDGPGFSGTLEGNNNAIDNFTLTDGALAYLGLLGMVTSGASLANLNMTNCQIEGVGVAAAIAATAQFQSGAVTFINCHVTGSITGTLQVSGMLSYASGNTGSIVMEGCSINAAIQGYSEVGGIAGYLDAGGPGGGVTIRDCHSQGSIISAFNTGGIVGYIECTDNASSSVTNCYSLMTIIEELSYVGGIAGQVVAVTDSSIVIQSCFSAGPIAGYAGVSGILADGAAYDGSSVTVTDCYSTGDRTSTPGSSTYDNIVGGPVGVLFRDGTSTVLLQNCYSTGIIETETAFLDSVAGGVAGTIASGAPGSAVLQNSVALEDVINGNTVNTARILGEPVGAFVTLNNNLAYDGMSVLINGVEKTPLDTGSTGLDGISATAAQLTTESTYQTTLGWNFTTIWSFGNGGYALPILRGIPATVQPTVLPPYLS